MRIALLFFVCLSLPNAAFAWWNDEWSKKLPITITAPADKAAETAADSPVETPSDTVILVKLHSGNFPDFFSLKENLADLRFIASDDKTPLKFHVDSFDLINQLLFVWVKVPNLTAGSSSKIWMYYGNEKGVAAEDTPGTYSVSESANFHFKSKPLSTDDATAYKTQSALNGGEVIPASIIGSGLKLNGASQFLIYDAPSNKFDSNSGFTISAWVKPSVLDSKGTTLFSRVDTALNGLEVIADTSGTYLQLERAGKIQKIAAEHILEQNKWQHLAVVAGKKSIKIFINGELIKSEPLSEFSLTGLISIGGKTPATAGFTGEIDQVEIAQTALSLQTIRTVFKNQGLVDEVVAIGSPEEAGAKAEDSGLFMVIIKSTDTMGWAVMSLLIVMSSITWLVMLGKGMYLSRVNKDNKAFLAKYAALIECDPAQLDKEDKIEDKELEDSPMTQALFGNHDHFQSSPIYRLYHRGIFEIRARQKTILETGLTARANNALRASLDAQTIREAQRLNSKMILLTIAISGGPFIGLFGTVMGVMMTFAGIAKTGDVNIAAIAPGVAAALLTTLGGLTVAIPALFGYNYLSSQIKEHIADMRVFCDEFATRLAEYYGRS